MFIQYLFTGGGRVVRWCWVSFQCRGVLLIWSRVGQGPTALAVGAGGGRLDIFFLLLSFLFFFFLSLGDGPKKTEILSQRAVKPKITNQPTIYLQRKAPVYKKLGEMNHQISNYNCLATVRNSRYGTAFHVSFQSTLPPSRKETYTTFVAKRKLCQRTRF